MNYSIRLMLIFIIVMLFTFSSVVAKELTGVGYGKTAEKAKKTALADLSSVIQVDVKSDFESIVGQIGEEEVMKVKEVINIKSDLPILGADFENFPLKTDVMVRVLLRSDTALKLYETKLIDLKDEIKSNQKALEETTLPDRKYELLNNMLTLIDQFYKYKIVAVILGSGNIPELQITRAEIQNILRGMETEAASLDLAGKLLAKGIGEEKIFVYPPTTRDSHEITQFGSVMKDRLSAYLNTVQSPDESRYSMKGHYVILENGIEITYQLVDGNFNTLKTKVVKLAPKSYTDYEIRPQTVSFDKLLHEGIIVSNNFRIDISSNKGKSDLLFNSNEEPELFVKSNKAGYFYMVGHIAKQDEKYSYLVSIQEAAGNRKFVYHVNADDVNKWISLGKFEVVKPYGVESIQLIASSKDLINQLPSAKHYDENGLYKITDDPEKGVAMTRALRPKKTKEVLSAEAVLMFTTMEGWAAGSP